MTQIGRYGVFLMASAFFLLQAAHPNHRGAAEFVGILIFFVGSVLYLIGGGNE